MSDVDIINNLLNQAAQLRSAMDDALLTMDDDDVAAVVERASVGMSDVKSRLREARRILSREASA